MIDEVIVWGLQPPLLVADAGYGDAGEFRQGMEDRDIPYVVQVASTATAYPQATQRSAPSYSGAGRRSPRHYCQNAPSVKELAMAAGHDAAREVTWRQGSRRRGGISVPMRSHFLFLRVRPAAHAHRRAHRGQDLPVRWLIAEWPPDQDEPTRYWFSDLPSTTPEEILVRLAKLRWRIEHDYRELKDGLGLDHYEGRTWASWHHHVTLVSAQPRTDSLPCNASTQKSQRRPEPVRGPPRTATILVRLAGPCPTCQTRFPTRKPRDRLRS
jgi:SRSO17 transposase